jgi:hypothetical protein
MSIPVGPKPELIEATEVCVVYFAVNRLLCRSVYHTQKIISGENVQSTSKILRFVSNDGNST